MYYSVIVGFEKIFLLGFGAWVVLRVLRNV